MGTVFDTPNDNDFVTQHYNPNNDPFSGGGLSILTTAQDTWDAVATSTFDFSLGDTNISRAPSLVRESPGRQFADGNNDFAWMPLKGKSTLGVTWTDFTAQETDVAINTNFSWYDDGINHFDAETVILHEFGHVLGLGHSTVVGSVMEAVYAGVRRDLHADDIAGITSLYGGAPAPVDAAPTVTITSPGGDPVDSGATVSFAGTASDDEDGDLTASLVWTSNINGQIGTGAGFSTTLSDGNHTITASVTDSGGNTVEETIALTVGTPSVASSVSVDSISYTTTGGRNGDKNLLMTVALSDDLGEPNSGAAVSIQLIHDSGASWSGSAVTGDAGTVTFKLRNAPSGVYSTVVTNVDAGTLNWDGTTPTNSFSKGLAGMSASPVIGEPAGPALTNSFVR